MKNEFKRLQGLFGVASPTVRLFEARMKLVSPKDRREWELLICRLAFGYYDHLPKRYSKFIIRYLVHDRACYVRYLNEHTPLGSLRYPLTHPKLFLKMVHLLESDKEGSRMSYLHLASFLLIAFPIKNTLRTLAEYLRTYRHTPEELLQLLGKTEIWED